MFRASLRPSSGGRTAFHCLWFSVLFIVVVILESRVVRSVHCDEDVTCNILVTVHVLEGHGGCSPVKCMMYHNCDVILQATRNSILYRRGVKHIITN
jgi:hypothetical protein